jgi:hypothetical protein
MVLYGLVNYYCINTLLLSLSMFHLGAYYTLFQSMGARNYCLYSQLHVSHIFSIPRLWHITPARATSLAGLCLIMHITAVATKQLELDVVSDASANYSFSMEGS